MSGVALRRHRDLREYGETIPPTPHWYDNWRYAERPRIRNSFSVTLILASIFMLAAAWANLKFGEFQKKRLERTIHILENLKTILESTHGPKTLAQFKLSDAWGYPLFVEQEQEILRVGSLGADHKRGGEGLAADVTIEITPRPLSKN